ncbi:EamA family transporter [Ramlibacter rhizophilus]|uniref:Phosphonate utilization protein n=1 Tax=Ramlibacter rhizophilus TaxID=1781167 RepID=A0A4Z0BIH7_9BURK|nr:EamA family transporter [Ramlibacter rhizophilus]TFY98580.1 phosphonate utilization protein [Ramlibacter rhizophilus]
MTLSWTVAGAVLLGALLHAGWNTLVKSSTDKALDNALISLFGALLALPLVAGLGLPAATAWPWLLASALIHVGYYIALTQAYRHGDLGLTYPLMRGTAPLLVALLSTLVLGEPLRPLAWVGVLAVCGGVLMLGLSRQALDAPRAVGFALVNAGLIAAYTLVDGIGVRASGDALRYALALFALNGWLFSGMVLARRGGVAAWAYARQRAPLAILGAAASFGSYALALWAMMHAPVAVVAALRETSVLFAALLGTWVLRERFSVRRAFGTAAIVAGAVGLRLA